MPWCVSCVPKHRNNSDCIPERVAVRPPFFVSGSSAKRCDFTIFAFEILCKMHLDTLSLFNFKNYAQDEFTFCPKINCLIGGNGVGKTNVLDAIHYLSLCKSCINPIDSQNIRYEADGFVIQGTYTRDGQQESISCGVRHRQKKVFKHNRKEYEKLSEHIGRFPLVMVSPMDNGLISEGSEERRRFMNEVISQYDTGYLLHQIQYNRTLAQRNMLLKQAAEIGRLDMAVLDALDMQLAMKGQQIFQARTAFSKALIPIFQQYYQLISNGQEAVTLTYRSQLQQEDMYDLLKKQLEKDRLLSYTSAGIHRDDLLLEMDGLSIKRTGSQGQQKTFLTALKLANYVFIRDNCRIKPMLLLDDIFDKFDAERVGRIMHIISRNDFGQVFITDTDERRLRPILEEMTCPFEVISIHRDANKNTTAD